MIYILLDETPSDTLSLKGEVFKYLVKVRRHGVGDKLQFRSRQDMEILFIYEVTSVENRSL